MQYFDEVDKEKYLPEKTHSAGTGNHLLTDNRGQIIIYAKVSFQYRTVYQIWSLLVKRSYMSEFHLNTPDERIFRFNTNGSLKSIMQHT